MKTDYLGNEINVGDEVVFFAQKYREFRKGKIIKDHSVMIDIETTSKWRGFIRQHPSQVIKIKTEL